MIRRRRINNLISLDSGAKDGSATIDVEDRSANIEHELTKELFSTEIQLALNNVNPGFRMAVILADVEGLSYEEVAAAMGTSVGTVRSRIHRGRLQMRKYLMKHFPAKFGGVGHYVL
jgi:RNA polymerase sigma-70 factor (ECF subfamily)